MYAFSVAGFVTLGTDRWRNCPSFWARSSSRPFGFFTPVGAPANQNGAHPWFVAEVFGRVLYRVQILGMMANKDRWVEGRGGHTLIVMVGEYWGDRRRQRYLLLGSALPNYGEGDSRSRSETSGGSFHSARHHPSGSQEDCWCHLNCLGNSGEKWAMQLKYDLIRINSNLTEQLLPCSFHPDHQSLKKNGDIAINLLEEIKCLRLCAAVGVFVT